MTDPTPAMIQAGVEVLDGIGEVTSEELVTAIYRAMEEVREKE